MTPLSPKMSRREPPIFFCEFHRKTVIYLCFLFCFFLFKAARVLVLILGPRVQRCHIGTGTLISVLESEPDQFSGAGAPTRYGSGSDESGPDNYCMFKMSRF
jgi:hypothetical protein